MSSPVSSAVPVPTLLRSLFSNPPSSLAPRLYLPSRPDDDPLSFGSALATLYEQSSIPAPPGLAPLTYIDDASFACVVLKDNEVFGWQHGQIIRWHLGAIDTRFQGALLDADLDSYIRSLASEHGPAWQKGYEGITQLAARYRSEFVERDIIPKAHDLRPFQLACQNVIIGLAALQQDVRIDGLSVRYWQTCDVPHVATHEGNRALSALMLCDAFQAGGTMEVSFSSHPERQVPASLRRFGRSLGLDLGSELPGGASISPTEARALFWAVTPMPDDLRRRAQSIIDAGLCSTERLCYSLMAPVWKAASLDFLLATSSGDHAISILEGGTEVLDRPARTAEMELMRAALLTEMLVSRLDSADATNVTVTSDAVRTFEDTTYGIEWHILGNFGAVEISGFPAGPLPWNGNVESPGKVIVLPRPHPIPQDREVIESLLSDAAVPVVILVPTGIHIPPTLNLPVMTSPARLSELDAQIERRLVASALGRV
jgi:hypothetical protein